MGWLIIFLCLYSTRFIDECHGARRKLTEVAYLNLLESCPGVPVTRSFLNTSYEYRGQDDFRISAYIEFNSSYENVQASHDISLCSSKEKESCQKFLNFNVEDYCEAAGKRTGFWTMIIGSFDPPLSCPLHGIYALKEYPLSEITGPVKKFLGLEFPTGNDFFHDRVILKHKQVNIACVDVMGSFRMLRSKLPKQ